MSGEERAPGWYADPWGTQGERYYDGTAWARTTRRPGGLDDAPDRQTAPAQALAATGGEVGAGQAAGASGRAQVPVVPPGWHPDPWGTAALRWWDGTRWTGHVSGVVTVPSPTSEREASRWARLAMLWAGPALGLYAISSAFQAIWIAEHWEEISNDGGRIPDGASTFASTMGQLAFLALGAAAVMFLMWFYRSAAFAAASGLPARRRKGLAVASFVIPVVNLWWPYQSTCDLLPQGHPARRKVLRWWLLCLGSAVAGLAIVGSAFVDDTVLAATTAVTVGLALFAAVAARDMIVSVVAAHGELLVPTRI